MMKTMRENYVLLINSGEEKDVLFLDFFADFPELTLSPTEELDFFNVKRRELPLQIFHPRTVMDGKMMTFYGGIDDIVTQITASRFNPDGTENANFEKALMFSLSPDGQVVFNYGSESVSLGDDWPNRDTMILFIMICRAYFECPEETVNEFSILGFLGVSPNGK